MTSLAPCLLKVSGQVDAQELRQAIAAYKGRGKKEADANIAAVQDKIAELDAQERRIVEAVRKAWEDDGAPAAQSKPEPKPGLGEAAPKTRPAKAEPAVIEDFGAKLEGARKDMAAAMKRAFSDDEIASLPLTKIWPAAEIDKIEDTFVAAVAFAARQEIPSKPRVAYKVREWVEKVKTVRSLAATMLDGSVPRERFEEVIKRFKGLEGFHAKVRLLEALPRDQWKRIERVREWADAYTYNAEGKQVPSPLVQVQIDGRTAEFDGTGNIADVIDQVREKLGVAAAPQRMKFEVRGNEKSGYFINKTGDREYRKLKTFATSKEALDYRRDHYDDLVSAWEAVKDKFNVKETDVRGAENRPRTGKDHRNGKDITVEQFQDAFSFKGGQFGNWVSQGSNARDRQWMLNNAYDALMDLSDILGVPSRALSLNGELGIAFGARGHGWASAHYEPDTIVINLTKTRGAGALAHEWFHALDNYFQRKRGNPNLLDRTKSYITYAPENYYENEKGDRVSAKMFDEAVQYGFGTGEKPVPPKLYTLRRRIGDKTQWKKVEGVRPQVSERFAELVETLRKSPMVARARLIVAGKGDGYWSRIIEVGARAFENYIIAKMAQQGYNNDYLANVTSPEQFKRDMGRYPYLLPEEIAPVEEAFDNLFGTMEATQTEQGVSLGAIANEPTWYYSQLARAFEQAKPESMPAGQWKAWLLSNKAKLGVKDDEIEWSGIRELLDLQKGRVTKQEIGAFLEQNGVRVQEVELGGSERGLHAEETDTGFHIVDRDGNVVETYSGRTEQTRRDVERYIEQRNDTTKFASYQLPGGENYRELLLTLPSTTPAEREFAAFKKRMSEKYPIDATPGRAWKEVLSAEEMSEGARLQEAANKGGRTDFRSTHFDQPNILAHVRFNERTDAEGRRVLFVEEIQSDWGQKGKKEGFSNKPGTAPAGWANTNDSRSTGAGIPSAPFVTDTKAWVALAMKRMISYAAANGYDVIAWTTGEQQADRYSLAKQVDRIHVDPRTDAATGGRTRSIAIELTGGSVVRFGVDAKGIVDNTSGAQGFGEAKGKPLADVIGKEMADRIMQMNRGVIEGEGLKVGGEGMRAFYDAIVPQVANDILKRIGGGKVGQVRISTNDMSDGQFEAIPMSSLNEDGQMQQPGFDITPAMLEKVAGGLPLFAQSATSNLSAYDIDLWSKASTGTDAATLLQDIAKNSKRPGYRQIAAALHSLGVRPTIVVGGDSTALNIRGPEQYAGKYVASYNPENDTITLLKPVSVEEKLTHEFVHSGTVKALRSGGPAAREMNQLFLRVQRNAKFKAYGLTRVEEFVAEANANQEFQALLDAMPVQQGAFKTAWQWFVDIVRRMLGLSVEHTTALDQVLRATSELLEENARVAGRGRQDILGAIDNGSGPTSPQTQSKIAQHLSDIVTTSNEFNWLQKAIGSQPGKAETSPRFATVYRPVEQYVYDTSSMAVKAQELMPNLIPVRDDWRDVFKSNATIADQKAVADALYAGTFFGGPSPMDGRLFTDEELRTGRTEGKKELAGYTKGQAQIRARQLNKQSGLDYEISTHPTQDGKFAVVRKGETAAGSQGAGLGFAPLTEKQIDLYHQARAALDSIVGEMAKAAMWHASRKSTGMTRSDMDVLSVEDAEQTIQDNLQEQIDDLTVTLEYLTDQDRIKDQAADIADMDGDAAQFKSQQKAAAEKAQRDIDALTAIQKSVEEIADDAEALIEHGYMPAMRFGEHYVTVKVPEQGGGMRVDLFQGFEFEYQANQAARSLREQYQETPGATVEVRGMPKLSHTMYEGVSVDGMERIMSHIQVPTMDTSGNPSMMPLSEDTAVQEWIASATATRSALRHHLHRKGVAGYSTDLERILSRFIQSGARLASSTYHMTEAREAWEALKDAPADVQDEAAKLIKHLTDPREKAAIPRNFMFVWLLGGEPIRFLVNRTQPVTVGMPWLMQYTSGAHAVELLFGSEPTDAAYKAAKQKAHDEGLLAPQEMHLLTAISRGNSVWEAMPSAVRAQVPPWMRLGTERLSLLWGAFQQISEQQNREQMFKAAWRLAKENPDLGDPMEFARRTIARTQFVYGQHAIPDAARPYLGQLAFTYSTFPIQFIETFIWLAKRNQKAAAMMLFWVWVFAGIEGEPFAENAEDVLDLIMRAAGHNWSSKRELRDALASASSATMAEAIMRGPASVLTGVDWGGRFSLGRLIPGTGALVPGEKDPMRELLRILGPMGSIVDSATKSSQDLFAGRPGKAAERMAPKGVQQPIKAYEMATTGEYRDWSGNKISDVSKLEAFSKALGGHPESVGVERRVLQENQELTELYRSTRSRMLDEAARADLSGDTASFDRVMKEQDEWNRKNPDTEINLKMRDIRKRGKEMSMSAEDRAMKRMPKALRGQATKRLETVRP